MSSIIQYQKNQIRKEMLFQRKNLDNSFKINYDNDISEKLLSLIDDNNWRRIHIYISIDNELSTHYIIQKLLSKSIVVVCPKTLNNRQLEHRELVDLNDVEFGIKGTLHPKNSLIYTGDYDLIVVPGLAFDNRNYRLGYGAGYYDTFLQQQPNAFKIALAYPFQIMENVPTEQHDVPIDNVIVI